MIRMLSLVLLTLVVLGCSSRPVEWENRQYPRPFTAEAREQFARDRYECEKEHRFNDRLIRLCMESRGWFQVARLNPPIWLEE